MEVAQARLRVLIRYRPLGGMLGDLSARVWSPGLCKSKRTHPAVHVEYAVALVDDTDVVAHKPGGEPGCKHVEGEHVAAQSEQNLEHVEAEKGIAQPACHGSDWLPLPRDAR